MMFIKVLSCNYQDKQYFKGVKHFGSKTFLPALNVFSKKAVLVCFIFQRFFLFDSPCRRCHNRDWTCSSRDFREDLTPCVVDEFNLFKSLFFFLTKEIECCAVLFFLFGRVPKSKQPWV